MSAWIKISIVLFLGMSTLLSAEDREYGEFHERGEEGQDFRRKGMRQGRKGKMRGFGKHMEQKMKSFMEGLPEEQRSNAKQIMTYLHTSQQVAKHHIKNKEYDQAATIFEKRLRLKVPAYFDGAPPMLKGFKLHTRVELGKLHLSRKDYSQAVRQLELALEESKKDKDLPPMMTQGIQAQLIRAYKKAGMDDKAQGLLQSSLSAAERGLEFE